MITKFLDKYWRNESTLQFSQCLSKLFAQLLKCKIVDVLEIDSQPGLENSLFLKILMEESKKGFILAQCAILKQSHYL